MVDGWFNLAQEHRRSGMECTTAGFRALRSYMKAVKGYTPHDAVGSRGTDEDERSESCGSLPELATLGIETAQGCNQERFSVQELVALRMLMLCLALFSMAQAVVMKDHQNLQARERSIRSMENILGDELERVAEKERNLDARILEITRLEARLHEALLQQAQQKEPQEVKPVTPNNALDEREAIIDLREKKLAFARVQLDEKEKHLKAKERVLNEQAAELSNFQARLHRKDKERESTDAMRIKVIENELRAAQVQQKASMEAYRLELKARCSHLEEREARIVYRERAAKAQAIALEQLQRLLLQQHEWSLMTQEDYLSSLWSKDREDRDRPVPHDEQQHQPQQYQPQQLKRKGTLSRFFK